MNCFPIKRKVCIVAGLLLSSITALEGQIPDRADRHDAQFEVASIKPDDPKSSTELPTNLDLDASDYFRFQGGALTADGYLVNYLIFAYRLRDSGEYKSLNAQLPKWAQYQRQKSYRLQARVEGHPTKDDLRRMVRSLLAERFGLKVHTETRQEPAWVLLRTSKSQDRVSSLRSHVGEPTCGVVSHDSVRPAPVRAGEPPRYCGLIVTYEKEGIHISIQDYTMPEIASELRTLGVDREGMEELSGVDGTQMTGHFDLDLRYASRRSQGTSEDLTVDQGPDFLQSLYTQAGVEFKKETRPVQVLIVDHVDEPGPD